MRIPLVQWLNVPGTWLGLALATTLAAGAETRIGDAWSDPANPVAKRFAGQRLDLWSLKVPVPVAVPAGRAVHPIDRFVEARLAERGMEAAPEADRRTLIRRVTYGLTGLPPTFDEVRAFESDSRPDAYERLVDRLLGSARYGEHQARWWLDVVRYSDSNGFDWDEFRPRAWRFRDYVVRSFNRDKGYARFVQEQLAGDELVPGAPQDALEQDALVATGFLRLGPHDNAAKLFNEQDRSRAELMADLVETTGSAFLGLTLSCCRCHDHKFDPLLQVDHYRMRAFFEGVKFADDLPLDLAPEQVAIRSHNAGLDARIGGLEKERDAILDAVRARIRGEREAKLTADERALLAKKESSLTDDEKGRFEGVKKKVVPSDKEVKAALRDGDKDRQGALEKEIAGLQRQRREFTLGLLMTDAEGKPPVTQVLFQGNHKAPREEVVPGFLSALDPGEAAIRRGRNGGTTGRRLTLAEWITSTSNPFTWRVVVNRVWQQHFGRGLVATGNDFGLSGLPPSHPELMDWLALEFVRSGGSFKALHRLIVTSEAYKRGDGAATSSSPLDGKSQKAMRTSPLRRDGAATSPSPLDGKSQKAMRTSPLRRGGAATSPSPLDGKSQKAMRTSPLRRDGAAPSPSPRADEPEDSENVWLARQVPRRLSAEQLRDSLLAVSGTLRESAGGPPVWPDLPPEILQANPAFLDDNETRTKGWYPSPAEQQSVRSLHLVQKRTVRVPFLETFDMPENSVSCARRVESTVAPQALSLLNSPMALGVARSLAARLEREAGVRPVERAFELVLQRPPTEVERRVAERLLADRGLVALCRAMINLNEFVYVD